MRARFQLLLLAALAACAPVTPMSGPPPIPTQEATLMPTIRYLALGDSYTIGESVSEPERWPNQLAALVEASPHYDRAGRIHVRIIARTGWTVDELRRGIQANPPSGIYDLVTLLIGVNDQYRGLPADGYRDDFRFLLGRAIEYAGGDPGRVIVLSIPDWGVTPFASGLDVERVGRQIDSFNAVNFEEAQSAGAQYVDVTAISRAAKDDLDLIAADGLHPSGKMYALWAEKTLAVALEILFR